MGFEAPAEGLNYQQFTRVLDVVIGTVAPINMWQQVLSLLLITIEMIISRQSLVSSMIHGVPTEKISYHVALPHLM